MMNSFLQREPTKAKLLSKLTNSTKTMARIIRMLDWTSPKDATVRLYAAKVTCELAKNLRVATFPGTMQLVSALLDTDSRQRGNKFLDTDDEQEKQDTFPNIEDSREEERAEVRDVADNQLQRQELRDNDNLVQTLTSATQPVGINKQNSCMLRCWQKISEFWSTPEEQLLTDHDFLPALAMSIIDSLAGCDQDNCVEISKAADLIPKVIGFTSNRSDMTNTEAQQKVLLKSSLKVLQRLTRIDGEIGITLRCKISKHPCILRNLADILGDNRRSQELRKLVAGILRNLAVDGNTRQEIGRIQLIITRLMQAFFHAEGTMSTNADSLLRKVAGQALTMLTTDSVHNCFVMLKEPELVKNLKTTILNHDDRYIYMAASLLRNLCLHARPKLRESDLKELSHTWREVNPERPPAPSPASAARGREPTHPRIGGAGRTAASPPMRARPPHRASCSPVAGDAQRPGQQHPLLCQPRPVALRCAAGEAWSPAGVQIIGAAAAGIRSVNSGQKEPHDASESSAKKAR